MLTDAVLAAAHHLAAFMLVAILAVEWALLRPGISAAQLRFVAALDGLYGFSAGVLVAVGIARLAWGAKGWAFYAGNPFFWTKMAVFGAIGLASIVPTVALLKMRRVAPDAAQVA